MILCPLLTVRFKSYKVLTNHYAKLAEQLNADLFTIGTEMVRSLPGPFPSPPRPRPRGASIGGRTLLDIYEE